MDKRSVLFGPLQPAFSTSPSAGACPHLAVDSAGGVAAACFVEASPGGGFRLDLDVFIRP